MTRPVKFNLCLLLLVVLFIAAAGRRSRTTRHPGRLSSSRHTRPDPKAGTKVAEWYEKQLPGSPIERQNYYQFDVMLPEGKHANSLPTETFRMRLWSRGIVPYVFGDEFTEMELFLFKHAIWQFNTQTCIRFVPRAKHPYYVTLEKSPTGCWSYTGRYTKNRWNKINLQSHCFSQGPGMIVHEMMHALGFHHEFIRPDREQYIWVNQSATIGWDMVKKNFATKSRQESEVYGTSFDYGSVMMYSRYAAAASADYPVMVNLKPWEGEFGNRTGFSTSDLIRLNYMYCNGTAWDNAVRKPFELPIPLDEGATQVPERPMPPSVINPEEEASMGDLVY